MVQPAPVATVTETKVVQPAPKPTVAPVAPAPAALSHLLLPKQCRLAVRACHGVVHQNLTYSNRDLQGETRNVVVRI